MKYNPKNNVKILALTFLLSTVAQAQSVIDVKSEGRKPVSKVIYRQSGVPAFELVQKKGTEMVKIKDIPKLDIGDEKQLAAGDADFKLPSSRDLKIQPVQAKTSPAMIVIPPVMLSPVQPLKKLIAETSIDKIPTVQPLAIVEEPVVSSSDAGLKNLVEIKPDEYKMLQALIFLEYQKKYDLAMNLFVELMDVPEYRSQALYNYAQTAYGLGLYSEFRNKMIQVTKETKDLALKKLAVESLVKNVSALENSDIGQIDPLVESFDIDITSNDKYLLRKAKYFSEKGDLGQLESALTFIPTTSPLYPEASLLKAVFNYRQGQLDTAITDIETAWPLIESNKKDQIRNLSALTLARLYFQKGDYKTSYQTYLKIDKSSPSWLQAMVEQAWTQILAGDNEGAAGNMFSLHTDFFRKAYAPDTYIVRTVGYLNLCQFGDGVSVLNDLQKRYKVTQEKLEAFKKNNQDPIKYYDLVKNWLRDTKVEEVEGIPRAFIVELARHPNYTTIQKQMNKYEEENSRFNKITIDLIRKEREARLKMLQTKNEFAVLKREKASPEKLRKKEQQFLAVGVEHMIISRAREGIKKMRAAAVARLDQEKDVLRNQVAKNLKSRYSDFVATLGNLVDQKDVLSYEIYSGAGEHIRFQMAGGQVQDRAPAALTPDENESYKWKFKGEVWEDEIGHYRSSLKNVCPSDDLAHNEGSN
ncbi:MAG: hypothetical protein H7256_15580 [Bdellovibrio sp.]|nr:hypothetical protein [Bdellovibrio sp.]